MRKNNKILLYRPEIDALRAIAVLSVIIFHFKKNLLPGGFLGVDIFFVISGYLITSLFIEEFKAKNSFSFSNFINKRLRRLLPAMLFTIFITIIPAYIFLLPSEFNQLINSSFFSIFFSSNFYFNFVGQDYWLNVASTKPLLNLWSLSLEVQYYLIFSLFIFIFFKYFRNFFSPSCLIVFFVSLIYVFNNSIDTNPSSFYLLHARIWEFLPGSLIALYQNRIRSFFYFINENVFIVLSILFFAISLIFYKKLGINIVYYNLFAVTGSCLLIIFLQPNTIFFKILTNKILVFIGLISYSLYLIHYPLIIIYRSFYFQNTYSNQTIYEEIIIIFLLFFLSVFSYFFIEKIFRNKKKINLKKFFLSILISITLIFSASAYMLKQNQNIEKSKFDNINIDNNFYSKEYTNNFITPINEINKKKKNLLIIGDSQANNFYMSLALNQNKIKNIQLNYIKLSNNNFKCLYVFLYDYTKNIPGCDHKQISLYKNFKNSINKRKEIYNLLNKSDYIFFSKRWIDDDIKYLNHFIKKIKDQNIIMISNRNVQFKIVKNKFTPLDISIIMNKKVPTNDMLIKLEKKYYEYYDSNPSYKNISNELKILANDNKIKYIDRVSFQCDRDNGKCYVLSDKSDKLVYDIDHFTLEGAKFFGKKIINSDQMKFLKHSKF